LELVQLDQIGWTQSMQLVKGGVIPAQLEQALGDMLIEHTQLIASIVLLDYFRILVMENALGVQLANIVQGKLVSVLYVHQVIVGCNKVKHRVTRLV
jgi:hypothetical protein